MVRSQSQVQIRAQVVDMRHKLHGTHFPHSARGKLFSQILLHRNLLYFRALPAYQMLTAC